MKRILLIVVSTLTLLSSCEEKPIDIIADTETPEEKVSGWYRLDGIYWSGVTVDLNGDGHVLVNDYLDEFLRVPGYYDSPVLVREYGSGVYVELHLPYPVMKEDNTCERITFLNAPVLLNGYYSIYDLMLVNPVTSDNDPFVKSISRMYLRFASDNSETFKVTASCCISRDPKQQNTMFYTFKKCKKYNKQTRGSINPN